MAVVAISDSILTDIADAIRSKNGTENTYKPSQMPDAIEAISGGGITPTGTIEITQNGVVDVTNYASADVDVPTGSTPTGTKQISITQNGTTTEDVTNYASAEIAVNVSGGSPVPTPTGITILDYVDSSGSCAVNLGMKFTYPVTGYSFFFRFGILDATSTQIVFSSRTTGSSNTNDQLVLVSGRLRMDRLTAGTNRYGVNLNDTITYINTYTNATNGTGCEYSRNETSNASYGENGKSQMRGLTPTYNFTIFGMPGADNTYTQFATVRFFELYYKEGSTEIIHLYPAKDSNNVKCLYDSVSETCLYPAVGQLV